VVLLALYSPVLLVVVSLVVSCSFFSPGWKAILYRKFHFTLFAKKEKRILKIKSKQLNPNH
jgi:hypothetical protein